MLVNLKEQYKFANFFILGFICYFSIHSFYFISLPEHIFAVPENETYRYYLRRAEIHLLENKKDTAIKRCECVIPGRPDGGISSRTKKLLKDEGK